MTALDGAAAEVIKVLGAGGGAAGTAWVVKSVAKDSLAAVSAHLGAITDQQLQRLIPLGKRIQERYEEAGSPDGSTPERVLRVVLDEGMQTDDPITREYLAGLAASAVTGEPDDDVSIGELDCIRSLSTPALRFHFHYYARIFLNYRGTELSLGTNIEEFMQYIPFSGLERAAFAKPQPNARIVQHVRIVQELSAKNLISFIASGSPEYLQRSVPPDRLIPLTQNPFISESPLAEGGFAISPTVYGANVWALGMGRPDWPSNVIGMLPVTLPPDIPIELESMHRWNSLEAP